MIKVLVDTDVLINFSKGFGEDLVSMLKLGEEGKIQLYVNPIIVAEFMTDKNLKNREKLEDAEVFLENFMSLDITRKMGFRTGEFMRNGVVSQWRDAMIAASCLIDGCELATRNNKHFKAIADLKLYKI